jgi:asparagine synthase (glutamine-hydrolysing)
MCGIVGALDTGRSDALLDDVRRAACQLKHRGPDDFGYFVLEAHSQRATLLHREATVFSGLFEPRALPVSVVLGHRRLSIIDLSESAAQPMTLQQGRYCIIHNGEIYNYRALRRELETLGHSFRTASDTEVLLAAYVQWGVEVLDRIEGMFAFAVLDLKKQVLFLARDAFGIKPLYYSCKQGRLAFASEIPALLEFPWIGRRANPNRVFEHLNYWTTDQTSGTFLEDIRALPAAHYLEVPLGAAPATVTPACYWDIPRDHREDIGLAEAASRLRELFLESVELHLQTDVPWCVALSGGIDSSSLTMAARQILGKDPPIHTVSFLANDPALNEEIWVDTVNHAAGATSHKLQIADADLGNDFSRLVKVQGQPMVTPVVYAQHRVFRKAGECGFKVLLEGQGADELLAGYPFYLQARLASMLKHGNWLSAARFLWSAPPRFLISRKHVLWHALQRAYPKWPRTQASNLIAPWISAAWAERQGVRGDRPPSSSRSGSSDHHLRAMVYDAVKETKLPSLLRYGDHNAMAASVENRVPFLTRKMAGFLCSLPEEHIIANDGTSKAVFRKAMSGITPEFVLRRKNRIGFEPPYRKWMQAMKPVLQETLKRARSLAVFDEVGLRGMCDQLQNDGIRTVSFANRVWRAACLAEWAMRYGVEFE